LNDGVLSLPIKFEVAYFRHTQMGKLSMTNDLQTSHDWWEDTQRVYSVKIYLRRWDPTQMGCGVCKLVG
jgi:hypothetical protein